jgi:hypothetical protein
MDTLNLKIVFKLNITIKKAKKRSIFGSEFNIFFTKKDKSVGNIENIFQ